MGLLACPTRYVDDQTGSPPAVKRVSGGIPPSRPVGASGTTLGGGSQVAIEGANIRLQRCHVDIADESLGQHGVRGSGLNSLKIRE
jgi:hypothetical protein